MQPIDTWHFFQFVGGAGFELIEKVDVGVLLLGLGARVERLAAINGFCRAKLYISRREGIYFCLGDKIESEPVRILDASGLISVF